MKLNDKPSWPGILKVRTETILEEKNPKAKFKHGQNGGGQAADMIHTTRLRQLMFPVA